MTNALDQFIGSTAYDRAGSKIGKVKALYLDERTAQPAWVTVHTGLFGLSESVVPVAGAEPGDGTLTVPVTKSAVKDAPHLQFDGRITPQQEAELAHHYHLSPPAAPPSNSDTGQGPGTLPGNPGAASEAPPPDAGRDPATTPLPGVQEPSQSFPLSPTPGQSGYGTLPAPDHGRHEAPSAAPRWTTGNTPGTSAD